MELLRFGPERARAISDGGADGVRHPLAAGDAVFWAAGEEHETATDEGLAAIVLEGETLAPSRG